MSQQVNVYRELTLKDQGRIVAGYATNRTTNTDGSVIKIGDATNKVSCGTTANAKFISVYTNSAATTGDSRAIYIRHYISGAGGDGEAVRALTTVNNVTAAGGTHGIHASLNFGASGKTTGLGVAGRFTLQIPDTAAQAGTLAAIMPEIYADGATSDTAGATSVSFIRPVISGDTTGDDTIEDDAVLFDFTGCGAISGGHVVITDTGNVDTLLKCRKNDGSLFYIMCTSTIT